MVIIGSVENEEPIPSVTIKPTMSMARAARALLPATSSLAEDTRDSTCPVAFMTEANPWAEIMVKPIIAIIFMPFVKAWSAWRSLRVPVKERRLILIVSRGGERRLDTQGC